MFFCSACSLVYKFCILSTEYFKPQSSLQANVLHCGLWRGCKIKCWWIYRTQSPSKTTPTVSTLLSIFQHTLAETGQKVLSTSQYRSHVLTITVYYCIEGYLVGGVKSQQQAVLHSPPPNYTYLVSRETLLSTSHPTLAETGRKVLQANMYPIYSLKQWIALWVIEGGGAKSQQWTVRHNPPQKLNLFG